MRLLTFHALCAMSLHAQQVLPVQERTNGVQTDEALSALRPSFSKGTLRVLNDEGEPVLTGTFIHTAGYFLTKASEAPEGTMLQVRLADDSLRGARVVQRVGALDLLLAKADVPSAVPVVAAALEASPAWGQWLVCATSGLTEKGRYTPVLRLGVVSAQRRQIRSSRGTLGLESADRKDRGGAFVSAVWPDSPAAQAGVVAGDSLLRVNDEPVSDATSFREALAGFRPGQSVALVLGRRGTEQRVTLRLGSYSRVALTAAGEDYANGGVSLRTDGFPAILQHDTPLRTSDMGSPVLDLEGRCVALNIARVDRVSTYALPVDLWWQKAQDWVLQDQRLFTETVRRAEVVAASR